MMEHSHHSSESDDNLWTINVTSLIFFVVILCCFFAVCFIWDNDFNYYRAPAKRREYVIRHVIVAPDDGLGV